MTVIGTSSLDVFPLVLGGNTFGWTSDETTSRQVLDEFVALGGNFIDTADGYSAWAPGNRGGESETIIGSWMATRGNRANVVIGTKVSQHPEFRGLSASTVAAAADASLGRLRTDYIDLYYAHFDDENTPLAETVKAFHDLVVAGKIRNIGVSNYSGARIAEWMTIAQLNGWTLPVAVQPHYNLVRREPFESEIAPVALTRGLAVIPYFALASGFLTGKYRALNDLTGAAREGMAGKYFSEEGLRVVEALDVIASAQRTSVATVALAWLAAQPGIVAPIASARTPEQLPALMASAQLRLEPADMSALCEASSLATAI